MTVSDLRQVDGKPFAVLLIRETAGEEEWAVLEGVARWDGEQLHIDCGTDAPPFPLPEHCLERIRAVDAELRQVLPAAEFCVSLLVGPLPENAEPGQYTATGHRWPPEDAAPAGEQP